MENLVEKFQESKACKLTPEERIQMGDEQANIIFNKSVLDGEKKEFLAQHNAKVKELDARLGKISEYIRSGSVHRVVECEKTVDWSADNSNGLVFYKRLDTKEVYHQRGLNAEERQLRLEADLVENAKTYSWVCEECGATGELKASPEAKPADIRKAIEVDHDQAGECRVHDKLQIDPELPKKKGRKSKKEKEMDRVQQVIDKIPEDKEPVTQASEEETKAQDPDGSPAGVGF